MFFGKTYVFTKDCVNKEYDTVAAKLKNDAAYCVKNPCWDIAKYPFCLCVDGEDKEYDTGCDDDAAMFGPNYINEESGVYNDTFSNPLIGMVRLMVLISTENYPDVMCKFL